LIHNETDLDQVKEMNNTPGIPKEASQSRFPHVRLSSTTAPRQDSGKSRNQK
jgi:hypothetical protein